MSDKTKPCDVPCPKCGSLGVVRGYFPKGASWPVSTEYPNTHPFPVGVVCALEQQEGVAYSVYTATVIDDVIANYCRICEWRWDTEPLGKAPAERKILPETLQDSHKLAEKAELFDKISENLSKITLDCNGESRDIYRDHLGWYTDAPPNSRTRRLWRHFADACKALLKG